MTSFSIMPQKDERRRKTKWIESERNSFSIGVRVGTDCSEFISEEGNDAHLDAALVTEQRVDFIHIPDHLGSYT
jgi:hypothetical protein